MNDQLIQLLTRGGYRQIKDRWIKAVGYTILVMDVVDGDKLRCTQWFTVPQLADPDITDKVTEDKVKIWESHEVPIEEVKNYRYIAMLEAFTIRNGYYFDSSNIEGLNPELTLTEQLSLQL